MDTATLRPGLLVKARTTVKGNVRYKVTELGCVVNEDGEAIDQWETERTTRDPAEQKAAIKVRSAARSRIQAACVKAGEFGLMCPVEREEKLREAVAQARKLAQDFNESARWTYIGVSVMIGRVSSDDVEAVRAINEQVRDLVDAMTRGVQALDPTAIRKAANEARTLSQMLEPGAQDRVKKAMQVARAAAKEIKKAAAAGAAEVDAIVLQRLEEARVSFLDVSDAQAIEAPEADGRAVAVDEPVSYWRDQPEVNAALARMPAIPAEEPAGASEDEVEAPVTPSRNIQL